MMKANLGELDNIMVFLLRGIWTGFFVDHKHRNIQKTHLFLFMKITSGLMEVV